MIDLLKELTGVIPAALIILCQWSLGHWLDRKKTLSPVSQWVLGLSVIACFNFIFLATKMGTFIHGNILTLIFLPHLLSKTPWVPVKPFLKLLSLCVIALFVSNVANPVINWDALCLYLHNAQHWAAEGWLDPDGLWNHYARRPQIVCVVYTWCLMWGNEVTCQTLDLFFFIGILTWLGSYLKLTPLKLLAALAIAATCEIKNPFMLRFVANGGNDFFTGLMALTCYEVFLKKERSLSSLTFIAIALLNSRWSGIGIFGIIIVLDFLSFKRKPSEVIRSIIFPLLFGCGWFAWNWSVHKNPFYPIVTDFFGGGIPSNSLLHATWTNIVHVQGIRSFLGLLEYFTKLGPIIFIFLISIFLNYKTHERRLLMFTLASTIMTLLITNQFRFQFINCLLISALFINHASHKKNINRIKTLVLTILLFCSLIPLSNRLHASWSLLKDIRHGYIYLLENRIRLYPAAQWLNENLDAKQKKEIVLWPMNPFYYSQNTGIRADEAAYFLPEGVLNHREKTSKYLKNMGIRWIVHASPMYRETSEAGPRFMEEHVDWMIANDPEWTPVVRIPKLGVSPETVIYKFSKNLQK